MSCNTKSKQSRACFSRPENLSSKGIVVMLNGLSKDIVIPPFTNIPLRSSTS